MAHKKPRENPKPRLILQLGSCLCEHTTKNPDLLDYTIHKTPYDDENPNTFIVIFCPKCTAEERINIESVLISIVNPKIKEGSKNDAKPTSTALAKIDKGNSPPITQSLKPNISKEPMRLTDEEIKRRSKITVSDQDILSKIARGEFPSK